MQLLRAIGAEWGQVVAGTNCAEGVAVFHLLSPRPFEAGRRARGGDMKWSEVLGVTVPTGDFRTPRAVVAIRCGHVVVRLTVRCLSGSRMDVLAPVGADGGAGIEMPSALWEAVAAAAVAAVETDGDVLALLLRSRRKSKSDRHIARTKRVSFDGEP